MTAIDLALDHVDAVALVSRQSEILEQIASGTELADVLTGIADTFEALVPISCCSVLLLEHDSNTLRHGAAPSLPAAYSQAIDGMATGPEAGSCGTAAHTGHAVVVADIRTDRRWVNYRELADRYGLRACWSTPIHGRDGISGTFAVYHPHPHRPTAREEHLVQRLTHLASVAIDHDQVLGALAASEEHFRRAFDDNAVGMVLATTAGVVTRVNQSLMRLLDSPRPELVGRQLDTLLTPTGVEPGPGEFEATARTSDGRVLDLALTVSPICDGDGTPRALSMNILDITGRRAAEQDRSRRVEAELARQAAEAANRAKSDFVAALGHELRTPLQAITGFTELLTTIDLDEQRRATALTHIDEAAGHILSMVNDVLDVARIEAGVLPVTLVDIAIEPVVAGVLAMVEPLAAAERITVSACPDAGAAIHVYADRRRVTQVLLNLVTNAIRYTRAGGTVSVDWAVVGDRVRIAVRDDGPGIAAEHLDRLFIPFDRLGRESEEGVGLGLPLARGLTEAMGGTLAIDSQVLRGTTVVVNLPRSGTGLAACS